MKQTAGTSAFLLYSTLLRQFGVFRHSIDTKYKKRKQIVNADAVPEMMNSCFETVFLKTNSNLNRLSPYRET